VAVSESADPDGARSSSAMIAEGERLVAAASSAGVVLRATGGIGVALSCPSAANAPLSRQYHDIDFVARSKERPLVDAFFDDEGYGAEEEFNALHGQRRVFYRHRELGWHADVFLDRIEMCHTLDVRDRLDLDPRVLPVTDLLLTKLQVIETNPKDYQDVIAILADHEPGNGIEMDRIDELCLADWGWWRTVTLVAERTEKVAEEFATQGLPSSTGAGHAAARLRDIREHLESAPKSRKWKLRAKIGERVPWHEEPEDVDHDEESQ
jgi:hypothetical protein